MEINVQKLKKKKSKQSLKAKLRLKKLELILPISLQDNVLRNIFFLSFFSYKLQKC